ncbi:hypothetical protein DYE49_00055 [Treponema rectale]|uniref:Uncharacterized protein n=1 Tax=Treponema rectale TaxID=744512 RepID=A0A7M1XLC8_9SPIR|nr:hypothetical protein DYE49_00055 [Treponema rectale]
MPMKINCKKLITSAMLTLIGASMVGSVAGTVAWYQYSTRASAAYVGTSTKCSEKLQVVVGTKDEAANKNDDAWKTRLDVADITGYIASQDGQNATTAAQVTPVTAGNQKKDAALNTLKAHPVYNYTKYSAWQDAEATDYVTFPLTFRVVDVDGGSPASTLAQDMDLYLQDLLIQAHGTNPTGKGNISDAIRVHFATTEDPAKYWLFSNKGETIDTCGELDLDGDTHPDAVSDRGTNYSFEDTTTLTYGDANSKEEAYKLADVKATDTNGALTGGQAIGKIASGTTLTINVTIWLEGWQKFGTSGKESAMWDPATYIGAMFDVGMTFAVTTI